MGAFLAASIGVTARIPSRVVIEPPARFPVKISAQGEEAVLLEYQPAGHPPDAWQRVNHALLSAGIPGWQTTGLSVDLVCSPVRARAAWLALDRAGLRGFVQFVPMIFDDGGWTTVDGLREDPFYVGSDGREAQVATAALTARLAVVSKALTEFREARSRLPVDWTELEAFPNAGADLKRALEFHPPRWEDADCGFCLLCRQPRPNGQRKPVWPAAGQRDIWVICGLYAHRNEVRYWDGEKRSFEFSAPTGVWGVVWSDGSTEVAPYEDACFAKLGPNLRMEFRGQTGLPKSVLPMKRRLSIDEAREIRDH